MEFKQASLENGLTIVAEVNQSAASLAMGFFVRTGSRDEEPVEKIGGVSHFLEHMLFKGTEKRSPFDINREFDQMGAAYNAFTSEENTVFYAAVLPEFQTQLLDLLGDMMRPALRKEDFETEKQVILEEIALYQDRPQHRLAEKLMELHFGNHPLSHSVLGKPETIQSLTHEDMLEYFKQRYSPSNITLAATGKVDWNALIDKADQTCSQWEDYPVSRKTPPPNPSYKKERIVGENLLREHIGMISPAPSAQDESRYAAAVMSTIIGDVTGSRLYYALIEPAVAEEASCVFEPMDGTGIFYTFICTTPDKANKALQIAQDEYANFVNYGPTEQETIAAKNKIASAATLKGELPMGRLTALGFDWIYRKEYKPLADAIERILAITPEQVHELARQYDLNNASILTLGPGKQE